MSFGRLVNRVWRENMLFSVLLELTYHCNLDCFFCYNDVGQDGRALSERQYLDLLEDLARLQVLNLTLSGGEPLAHPSFFSIGARARELGFLVRVKTNGHALGKHLASRLQREVDPFVIDISLHGARAHTHDRQTRITGSFDRLMQHLKLMTERGMRIKLNAILTAWNEDELEGMYALADGLNIPLTMDPTVTPCDNGDTSPYRIRPSISAIRRLCELQAQREPERFVPVSEPSVETQRAGSAQENCDGIDGLGADKHCGAGASALAIDPFGNVFPCVQWRRPLGNIHRQSVSQLWKNAGVVQPVRELGPKIRVLIQGLGAAAPHAAFCPGLAELETGSPMSLYRSMQEKLSVVRAIQSGLSEAEVSEANAQGIKARIR